MDFIDLAGKLLISLAIGAIIGLERESQIHSAEKTKKTEHTHKIGVRTFSLLTVLGAVAGILINENFPIFVFISTCITGILFIYYIMNSYSTGDSGFTTELAILYSYVIGILIATEIFPIQFIIAFSVILVLILSRKADIQSLLKKVMREELNAFISYALIALVILPFLPNKGYALSDMPSIQNFLEIFNLNLESISKIEIINPFKLWFIVVAITGIDLLGHVLERIIGTKRGRILASIVGGFISSTATTISLAQESKKAKNTVNYLVSAAIFANVASFFPLLILISLINSSFIGAAAPFLIISAASGTLMGIYFVRNKKTDKTKFKELDIKGIKESEIFAILPAIKFGMLFLSVTIITKIALEFFGQAGFLISSSIAALTGTDAITINIANLVGKNIDIRTGLIALILMNTVNLTGKTIYCFIQGTKEFAVKFGISITLITLASLTGLFFL